MEEEAYNQYNKLEDSKRKILGIEKSGTEVQRDLHQHTEKMLNINNNVGVMNLEIDNSQGLIKRMLKRETKNKLLMCSVFFALVIIFLIILIVRLSGSSDSGLKQNLNNGDNYNNDNNKDKDNSFLNSINNSQNSLTNDN